MSDPARPLDLDTLAWSVRRVEDMAGNARINAEPFGPKILKGYGYPNEVMSDAQDALALETVLRENAALLAHRAQLREALQQARALLRRDYPDASLANGYWPTVKPLIDRLDAVLASGEGRGAKATEEKEVGS